MKVIRESRSGGVNLVKAGVYQHRGEGRDGGKGGVGGGGVVGARQRSSCKQRRHCERYSTTHFFLYKN